MKQLHEVQLHVLKKLLFAPSMSYTDLKPSQDFPGNTFSFHLDKLKDLGHIVKEESLYILTNQGKEYANRIEDTNGKIAKPQKVTAVLCCSRQGKDELEYLIYTRKKHPFYGKQGLFSGKIKYGEFVEEGAQREMLEETNLTGDLTLIMILHEIVKDTGGILLEDKYLHVFHCNEPEGKLIGCEEGDYDRIPKSQITSFVTNPFGGNLSELNKILEQSANFHGIKYFEEIVITDGF